jgi:hypothetical protein
MQQKGIGEFLGKRLWVRQTIGVHKPFIRALEAVLRRPGLSFGKVVILCGGPDWPTSVTCGLLRLSLWSCEVGTTPIIFYIAPFSLTGSFYLRKGEPNPIWENLSNLLILVTLIQTIVYWAACAWVIQNTLFEQYDEVSRRLPQYVDLEWLDFRSKFISDRAVMHFRDLPLSIRVPYVAGLIIIVPLNQALYIYSSYFFGKFSSTDDDIETLYWYGDEKPNAIIKDTGALALILILLACISSLFPYFWIRSVTKTKRLDATSEASLLEADWKENFLRLAKEMSVDTEAEAETPTLTAATPLPAENQMVQTRSHPERTPETPDPDVPERTAGSAAPQSSQAQTLQRPEGPRESELTTKLAIQMRKNLDGGEEQWENQPVSNHRGGSPALPHETRAVGASGCLKSGESGGASPSSKSSRRVKSPNIAQQATVESGRHHRPHNAAQGQQATGEHGRHYRTHNNTPHGQQALVAASAKNRPQPESLAAPTTLGRSQRRPFAGSSFETIGEGKQETE